MVGRAWASCEIVTTSICWTAVNCSLEEITYLVTMATSTWTLPINHEIVDLLSCHVYKGIHYHSWTRYYQNDLKILRWEPPRSRLPSCLPDVMHVTLSPQVFPLYFYILQAIKNWRWEWPRNETMATALLYNTDWCILMFLCAVLIFYTIYIYIYIYIYVRTTVAWPASRLPLYQLATTML